MRLADKMFYPTCQPCAFKKLRSLGFNYNALLGDPKKVRSSRQKLSAIQVPALRAMYPAPRFFVSALLLGHIYIGLQLARNDAVKHKAAAVANLVGTRLLKQRLQSKGDCKDILSGLDQASTVEEAAHQKI